MTVREDQHIGRAYIGRQAGRWGEGLLRFSSRGGPLRYLPAIVLHYLAHGAEGVDEVRLVHPLLRVLMHVRPRPETKKKKKSERVAKRRGYDRSHEGVRGVGGGGDGRPSTARTQTHKRTNARTYERT